MSFRVTPQGRANQIIGHLQRNTARLNVFQEQMATGKRLERPSDGPVDTAAVRANKADDLRLETNLNNIRDVQFILQNSENALLEVREILTEASEITIEAKDPTVDTRMDAARRAEVAALTERLMAVVNRRLPDGRYLFSGTTTDTAPFSVTNRDASGSPNVVTYQGSLQNVEVIAGRGQTVETIYSGEGALEDVFTALIALRNNLNSDPNDHTRPVNLGQRLDDIERITADVLQRVGDQGADLDNLEAIRVRIEDAQFEIRKVTNELESADLADAIINLQAQQNTLQASLLAAARINNLSLADFL